MTNTEYLEAIAQTTAAIKSLIADIDDATDRDTRKRVGAILSEEMDLRMTQVLKAMRAGVDLAEIEAATE